MLDFEITRDREIIGKDTALNDVVISKGALSRIAHVKTSSTPLLTYSPATG